MINIKSRSAFVSRLRSVGNLKRNLTDLSVYAVHQAAVHGNLKEVTELFNSESFLLQSGKLNAIGRQLRQYVTTQYRGLKITEENAQVLIEFSAAIDTTRRHLIIDLQATDKLAYDHGLKNGDKQNGLIYQSKSLYTDDFSKWQTFSEFENKEKKADDAPKVRNVSAKTMLNNINDLLADQAVINGDYKTLLDLSDKLAAFKGLIDKAAQDQQSSIELAAFDTSNAVKPSAKSKAAN